MRVFVTGAGGFIGGELARYLCGKGWTVRGSSHNIARLGEDDQFLEQVWALDLNSRIDSRCFEGCDAVIHCAYDPRPGKGRANVEGTERIYRAAASAGVPFQLFLSSHSARHDAISEYGKQKFEIEGFFLAEGQAVVRPGLVIGNGGLFARNRRTMSAFPLLVLPGADRIPVFYIALHDLLISIETIVARRLTGAHNIFVQQPVLLREFVETVLAAGGKRAVVVSLPFSFFSTFGLFVKKIGLGGSIALFESIEAARLNLEAPVHVTDIAGLVAEPADLKDALARA